MHDGRVQDDAAAATREILFRDARQLPSLEVFDHCAGDLIEIVDCAALQKLAKGFASLLVASARGIAASCRGRRAVSSMP